MRFSDMAFTRALARSAGVSSEGESGATGVCKAGGVYAPGVFFGAVPGELDELLEPTDGRRRGTGLCVGLVWTTSKSKSLTKTIMELAGSAFAGCGSSKFDADCARDGVASASVAKGINKRSRLDRRSFMQILEAARITML